MAGIWLLLYSRCCSTMSFTLSEALLGKGAVDDLIFATHHYHAPNLLPFHSRAVFPFIRAFFLGLFFLVLFFLFDFFDY